ncbi:MAG: DUF1080 domain-containing protein [Bryobacteraceae bacterium]|nr:DUF1080 domain-containing protein [Bryobacteraceae bacterium]
MKKVLLIAALLGFGLPLLAQIPPGFTDITPGPGLKGWHRSLTTSHGTTEAWKVENGVVSGTQDREGNGGIILTDRKYKNFEVYLEMNPDFGCDSGLFLRSNERGQAYQVMLDYLEKGNMGGIYGEGLKGVKGAPSKEWERYWKKGEWNSIRARIEGDVPHIQVWMNGQQITDWKDTENHLPDGAAEGMIALQVHGGNRCKPGLYHRFRNVAVRELP